MPSHIFECGFWLRDTDKTNREWTIEVSWLPADVTYYPLNSKIRLLVNVYASARHLNLCWSWQALSGILNILSEYFNDNIPLSGNQVFFQRCNSTIGHHNYLNKYLKRSLFSLHIQRMTEPYFYQTLGLALLPRGRGKAGAVLTLMELIISRGI